jgi:hypothetical protein
LSVGTVGIVANCKKLEPKGKRSKEGEMGRWMDRARTLQRISDSHPEKSLKVGDIVIVKSFSGKQVTATIEDMIELSDPAFKLGTWIMIKETAGARWVHHSLASLIPV